MPVPTLPDLRRSLLTRIYLIGVLGLLLTAVVGKFTVDQVMEFGRRSSAERPFHRHITESIGFLAEEVGESIHDGRPDPKRFAKLATALNYRMQWIPWSETQRYPAELTRQPILLDPRLPPGLRPGHRPPDPGRHHVHWARVDHDGRPIGALRVQPFPFNRPPFEPPPLLTTLVIVALIMPAIIWIPATMRLIVRPLRQMKDTAHRLGAGDLESPVPVDRQDEFGELQQAFEAMRTKIRRMLAEREQLLTDISHELRGPLSRLNLALPLLAQQAGNESVAHVALREVATMDSLIGEILALFRSTSQGMVVETIDLADLAAEAVEERLLVADANQLTVTTDLQPALIRGDAKLVARAISNLLDNALKYTGPGGTIHVETHSGAHAVCRIRDNGPGIAPEHLPHIWEPFYRPDSSRSRETGGSGLGLSIVQAIVERLGGQATLDSQPGQGTVATIQLPKATQTGPLAPSAAAAAAPVEPRS
jgi:signal transduction histidine kinase